MRVKICGLTERSSLEAALGSKADFLGLVFYPPSPRFVDEAQAIELTKIIRDFSSDHYDPKVVALFVQPDFSLLDRVVSNIEPDFIKLHGGEGIDFVRAVNQNYSARIIKAISVSDESDLNRIDGYVECVDWLLFDTKVKSGDLPGGTGESFDWNILKTESFDLPWMLSGGLKLENIHDALSLLTPDCIDVSSGVEKQRGVKDPDKIRRFISAVKSF